MTGTKPLISYRRIDRLKAIAFERGLTNEDAKQFGKLSKTATWETLLELYFVEGESLDTMLDTALDKTLDNSVDTLGWTNGRSQILSTPQTVVLDRETMREICRLAQECQMAFIDLQQSQFFLFSFHHYLLVSEEQNFGLVSSSDVAESLLLVNPWIDVVSQKQKQMYIWLDELVVNLRLSNAY